MRQLATNKTVSKYITIDARDQAKLLASTLLTMRPYNASFASEIYRCSDAGLALSFVATLDNMRTLVQLTQAAGEEDILEGVRTKEKHYLDMIGRWRDRPGKESGLSRYILDMSCPTETARQVRKDSWGFEIHAATFAHPVDQIRFLDID